MSKNWRNAVAAAFVAIVSMASAQAQASVVALWDFQGNLNDTSGVGTAMNLSIGGNTGAPGVGGTGVVPGGTSPPSAQAFFFANTPSYLYYSPGVAGFPNTYVSPTANKLELQSFTVEAWVHLSILSSYQVIFAYEPMGTGGYGKGFYLGVSPVTGGAVPVFYIGTGSTFAGVIGDSTNISNVLTQPDTWYHIAGSYDGATNTGRVFLNGVQTNLSNTMTGPVDYTDAVVGNGPDPKSLIIGGFFSNYGQPPTYSQAMILSVVNNYPNYVSRVDRVMLLDTAVAAGGNGQAATTLDFFAPEPASLALLGLGGLMLITRRR